MTAEANIFLLADPRQGDHLARSGSPPGMVTRPEPFAALGELSHRPYQAVLVTAPQPRLRRLLKAIRRLQPAARVFGLCTPAAEHDLRRSIASDPAALDDYFIIPPTSREWRRIAEPAVAPEADRAAPPGARVPAPLPADQLTDLIEAAVSLDALAACVARMVGAACRMEVRWARQGQGRPGVQRLLTLEDDPPRVLWSAQPLPPDTVREHRLASLRALLPALAMAARRTGAFRRMAITDDLTGAYNRRYFMHFADKLLDEARRRHLRATMLLYDIDDFKVYNDQYGHAAGDDILRETARLMKQITRRHDLVARIGGDEFAVLFCDFGPARQPNSQPLQTAFALAERFRKAVNSFDFRSIGPKARGTLTISGGLAGFPWDGYTVKNLLARADEALHRAKADGKNNIYLVGKK